MTWAQGQSHRLHRIASIVAVLFGLLTIVSGSRVLMGSDPGYVVFRPLLVFNTVMGFAYVAAGLAIWQRVRWSVYAAGAIVALNLVMLGVIVSVRASGGGVAVDSLRAMTFRSVVWLVLFAALVWMRRNSKG